MKKIDISIVKIDQYSSSLSVKISTHRCYTDGYADYSKKRIKASKTASLNIKKSIDGAFIQEVIL